MPADIDVKQIASEGNQSICSEWEQTKKNKPERKQESEDKKKTRTRNSDIPTQAQPINNRKLERVRLYLLTLQPPRKALRINQIRRKPTKRILIVNLKRRMLIDRRARTARVHGREGDVS